MKSAGKTNDHRFLWENGSSSYSSAKSVVLNLFVPMDPISSTFLSVDPVEAIRQNASWQFLLKKVMGYTALSETPGSKRRGLGL